MTYQPSLDDYIRVARDVPEEVIDTGLARVDWDAIRAGEADPKDAAAHAIRFAAIAHEGVLRKQIAADIRAEKASYRPGTLRRIVLEQAAVLAEKGNPK